MLYHYSVHQSKNLILPVTVCEQGCVPLYELRLAEYPIQLAAYV